MERISKILGASLKKYRRAGNHTQAESLIQLGTLKLRASHISLPDSEGNKFCSLHVGLWLNDSLVQSNRCKSKRSPPISCIEGLKLCDTSDTSPLWTSCIVNPCPKFSFRWAKAHRRTQAGGLGHISSNIWNIYCGQHEGEHRQRTLMVAMSPPMGRAPEKATYSRCNGAS